MASASHAPEGPGVQILQQGQPLTELARVRAVSGGCKGLPREALCVGIRGGRAGG